MLKLNFHILIVIVSETRKLHSVIFSFSCIAFAKVDYIFGKDLFTFFHSMIFQMLIFLNIYLHRMALTSIKDLKPGDRDKIIEAKVYRAWAARNPPDTTEKGYRAILLDRQVIKGQISIQKSLEFLNHDIFFAYPG